MLSSLNTIQRTFAALFNYGQNLDSQIYPLNKTANETVYQLLRYLLKHPRRHVKTSLFSIPINYYCMYSETYLKDISAESAANLKS